MLTVSKKYLTCSQLVNYDFQTEILIHDAASRQATLPLSDVL